jgi:hypothetical protein
MAGIRYVVTIENASLGSAQVLAAHQDRAKTLRALSRLIDGINAGDWRCGRFEIQSGAGTGGTAAAQTVVYSGSSGAQTVVIQGTSVAFTAGATDALTVQAAIAAIRADPVAKNLVFIPTAPTYGATINTGGTLTLWANMTPATNALGNNMTLSVTGTGATATGATFAGGVAATANGFNL